MESSKLTIQDCIDMFENKDMCVVLNDGLVIGFVEKSWKW